MSVSIKESIAAQIAYDCRPDASECWCRGSGWVLSNWDSFHRCPYHYDGQPHPEESEPEYDSAEPCDCAECAATDDDDLPF